jgi:hypothetical protein
MVYLSKIENKSRLFSVVPKTHYIGKTLREFGWLKHNTWKEVPNRHRLC